ncbi:MAG TPA: hypothetical protein VF188_00425 [Longimicrobiales bacterium]
MSLDPKDVHALEQFEAWVTEMAAALVRMKRRMVEEAHVPPGEADQYVRMIAQSLFGEHADAVLDRRLAMEEEPS